MNTILIIIAALIVGVVVSFFVMGMMSKSGDPPGMVDGRLSDCPDKPNCVCSEREEDTGHYIDPIPVPGDVPGDFIATLKEVVQEMGGSIQAEDGSYVAATFTSGVFGFVDDVELRIDTDQKVIHVRSASRVGYGDLGVNGERVTLLKRLFTEKVSKAGQSP